MKSNTIYSAKKSQFR